MQICWKILTIFFLIFLSKFSESEIVFEDDEEDDAPTGPDKNAYPLPQDEVKEPDNPDAEDLEDRRRNSLLPENDWPGKWEIFVEDSGVSALHAVLLPRTNKVLFYDTAAWRVSNLKAHSVLLDVETGKLRGLKLDSDTWGSSGGLTPNGTLISTGGSGDGANTVRYLSPCDACEWVEHPKALAAGRWGSTQVALPDGNFIVYGGRNAMNYEFVPAEGATNKKLFLSKLLEETNIKDKYNLYPHVFLSTDGNIFVFANDRSVLLDWRHDKVVRVFPLLPGGARNYPAAASSVLLPIFLNNLPAGATTVPAAEVLVCGGAKKDAYANAGKKSFSPALQDCGRMTITSQNPKWEIEKMPSPRVMGDAVFLSTGDVLIVNGAKKGCSGQGYAAEPNLAPVLYMPERQPGERFRELTSSKIPRMYQSSAILLADGKVLVAGSHTNNGYEQKTEFPTELRVEKFSPPYLDPNLAAWVAQIVEEATAKQVKYGQKFRIQIKLNHPGPQIDHMRVTIYAPGFSTHSVSMNQRLLVLALVDHVDTPSYGVHNVEAVAPPSGNVAPPGYYLLYVTYLGVPSVGHWVQVL